MRLVQRCQWHQRIELSKQCLGYLCRASMIATGMHHAMPGSDDGEAIQMTFQSVDECGYKHIMHCGGVESHEIAPRYRTALRSARRENRAVSDPGNLVVQDRKGSASFVPIERELDAGGPRVQDKEGVCHDIGCALWWMNS